MTPIPSNKSVSDRRTFSSGPPPPPYVTLIRQILSIRESPGSNDLLGMASRCLSRISSFNLLQGAADCVGSCGEFVDETVDVDAGGLDGILQADVESCRIRRDAGGELKYVD